MLRFLMLLPLVGIGFWIFGLVGYGFFNLIDWYMTSATSYTATAWYSWPWNWPGATIVHRIATQFSGVDHIAEYAKSNWENGTGMWPMTWILMIIQSSFAAMVNVALAIAPASCAFGLGELSMRVAKACKPGGITGENLMRVHKLSVSLLMPLGFLGLLGWAQGMDVPLYVSNTWRFVLFAVASGAAIPIAIIAANPNGRPDEA